MEVDVEVELPVEIIQRIQSTICKFNGEQEAARTTLVSKSWYHALSTRPDLVFNQNYWFRSGTALFWKFSRTTTKRYEDLNLNIRSLKLVIIDDHVSVAKELIVKALNLRVVDLTIEIWHWNRKNQFVLPHEVLRSQTLARLNLSGFFIINLEKEKVTCYNLKSLELVGVTVYGDLCMDLISRCPLIEELTLDNVYDIGRKLDDDQFDKPLEFPKVKYMSLKTIHKLPRHDWWARFACLKELELVYYGNEDLRIRIPSLERISILLPPCITNDVKVEFDFPNIQKLQWKYALPQRFEVKTCATRSYEWDSTIDIIYNVHQHRGEWFSRLSQLLRMLSLSQSRVYLSIKTEVSNWDEFNYHMSYFGDGLPIAPVEKLKLSGYQAVTPAFLNVLFWSCRPKFVEIRHRCLFGMKKENVEAFQQLRSLPWEAIYRASSDEDGDDVRFQLN